MSSDLNDHHGSAAAATPARLGRFIGHLERDARGRCWRGRLPLGAVAPLLAAAATGRPETLMTAGATETVLVGAVWFDAELGDVECELASPPDADGPAPSDARSSAGGSARPCG